MRMSLDAYSFNRIEDILDEVDLIAQNNDYEFVSATYEEDIVGNNKINLIINVRIIIARPQLPTNEFI